MRLLEIDARQEVDRVVARHWQRFTERLSRLLAEGRAAGQGAAG